MLKKFTLLTFLFSTTLAISAQSPFGLCEPATDFGTNDGDYIGSIDYNGTNLFAGFSGSDFINYNTNLINATIGYTTYIDITNTSEIISENIQVWVDLDGDGILQDPSELMAADEFTATGQTITLQFTIPSETTPKTTACRILMHYIMGEDSPCDFLTYGQIVDFPISLNSDTQGACSMGYTLGPLDGDFISEFYGNNLYYTGGAFSPAFELLSQYENTTVGSTVTFNGTAGTYGIDYYHLYVDENYNGFETEDLKDSHLGTTANETFELSYTIPADISQGVYRARLVCRFSDSTDPCSASLGYGHTIDFYMIYNDVDASPYCNPITEYGTAFGDFIAEYVLTNSSVGSYQTNPGTFYNYYSESYPFYALAEKSNSGYIISGTYDGTENYKVWIDYNQNNTFDSGEQMVAAESLSPGQQVDFNWNNPSYSNEGNTRMRVMCHFTDNMSDPCDASDYGEVEDYPVVLVKSNDTYCDPYFNNGNADGDYINAFSLNEVNLTAIGAGGVSFYNDYTSSIAQVLAGNSYTINAQGGDYSSDTYKVWVDWNNDGIFDDGTEALAPSYSTSSEFENMTFTFTVPADAALGNKRLRMVCSDNSLVLPCQQDSYGEYLEITVAVVAEIGVQNLMAENITLFPNPGRDNLTIQYTGESNVMQASIYNAMGQLIESFQVNKNYSWNHNYVEGYYTMKLSNGASEVHKVFIVE